LCLFQRRKLFVLISIFRLLFDSISQKSQPFRNQITGTIPTEIANMISLQYL
jgi:hypothetical protein